jgi:hypothetical protein
VAAPISKCTLDGMLQSILSVALQEQNMAYPPWIYQQHINIATSMLISALAKSYPNNPMVVDQLDPFVKFCMLPVTNGYVTLPGDYRNMLGSPYIFANPKQDGECGAAPQITTQQEMQVAQNKGQCKVNPLYIVDQAEFSERTKSTYNFPTHKNPIAYFSGKKQLKVCPYDLTRVAVLYVQNEKTYVYPYIVNPDDTYYFNSSDPALVESEWGSNAFEPLFNSLLALYSAYTRDQELGNWARILNSTGIL